MDGTVDNTRTQEITAEAYLARLAERGIEYVFANAGTDFAPIVEALARNAGCNKFPRSSRCRTRTSRSRWRTAITAPAASPPP